MKLTIVYDNTAIAENLTADWGFACVIEVEGAPRILFDTGAKGEILLDNMKKLGIEKESIDEVVISHNHWDHTGGIESILKVNPEMKFFVPEGFPGIATKGEVVCVDKGTRIHDGIYLTGTLGGIEESMVIECAEGNIVVAGCSHPGLDAILDAAREFGKVSGVVGGFHGFDNYGILETLDFVCPTHCTEHPDEIISRYPEKYIPGGAGKIFSIKGRPGTGV